MKRLAALAATGAVVGSLLRYIVTLVIPHSDLHSWPWATFAVNVVGAFIIGVVAAMPRVMTNEQLRHFLVTGVLGGFTTFSALAVETIQLNGIVAWSYIAATFVAGVLATHIGTKVVSS